MTVWIIAAAVAIMLASLAGVFFVWSGFGSWIEKNLGLLTSFAAGIFLIVSGQLVLHTLDTSGSILEAVLYIVGGVILVLLLFRFVPLFHHHHHPHEEGDQHHSLDIRRILFGDALHNIGDGLLIAVAFSSSVTTGIVAAIGIFFHEVVQEVSEFFVLKQGGLSTSKALLVNFAVSGTILVGIAFGLIAVGISHQVESILLGITAGSFLVVVGHDLIPHSIRASKKNNDHLKHIGWFVLGIVLMLGVLLVLGETHSH